MKQLNRTQSAIFLLGGALMVIGAGSFSMMWHQPIFCWVFLVGALLFAAMQTMQSYEGGDITLRRLKRVQGLAGLMFVLAGMLMADNAYGFFRPLFANMVDYCNYVFNKWVALLLIAVVLEVYSVHRIDRELSKKS